MRPNSIWRQGDEEMVMLRKSVLWFVLSGLAFVPLAGAIVPEYTDYFNDTIAEEHNWQYWGVPDGGGAEGNQALQWMANGGESGSARLTIDMQYLTESVGAFWPYFLQSSAVGGTRAEDQELNFSGHEVSAIFNSHNIANPLNGGALYFFVGQYEESGDSAWYYFQTPFTINPTEGDWSPSAPITITGESAQWTLLGGSESVPVSALLNNPQQYGFVVVGAGSQPTFNISMDNFSSALVVPEPGLLGLLALGAMLVALHKPASKR